MTTMTDAFKGKIAMVTGGNSGIGYALCEELLKRGAIVYMAGRNPAKVAEAAKKLAAQGDRIHTVTVDVTKQAEVQKAIEDTVTQAGRLDFLFNNAGVGGTKPFEQATLEEWKTIIDTNLWSVIYGVHAAVPIMLKQGSGHIVNTSSAAGLIPPPYQSLYSATKFGVTGLTESLRYEYADRGIHFSTICPSNIATPIFTKDIKGTVYNELKIPDDAYPVDKAASLILDRVAEHKGIIVVPEDGFITMWHAYAIGSKQGEEFMVKMARDRAAAYAKGGNYY
jgi:NAD(P)-dependent dehydrogenase (short-subunit alcohol dehydrogenase family)